MRIFNSVSFQSNLQFFFKYYLYNGDLKRVCQNDFKILKKFKKFITIILILFYLSNKLGLVRVFNRIIHTIKYIKYL